MIRYHVTPTRNIPSILRWGLRPSRKGGRGGISEFGEHTYGIFFFDTLEDVVEHLGLGPGPGPMISSEDWTLLEIDVPSRYDLHEFEEYPGLVTGYTTRRIPPSCIRDLGSLANYRSEDGKS